jgi:hypothetical protein
MQRVSFASKYQLCLREGEETMDDFAFENIVVFSLAFERRYVF